MSLLRVSPIVLFNLKNKFYIIKNVIIIKEKKKLIPMDSLNLTIYFVKTSTTLKYNE